MTLSILHISDLHRDPTNPIGNQVLLDSLERDRDRYTAFEHPIIRPPDLIIVSGDIVQGVKHDEPNPETTLRRQYDEALSFLNALAERFVDNDKQSIVVVPGNHDVSDYHFRKSLQRVDIAEDARKVLVAELFTHGSPLRWEWSDFVLYRITDQAMYEQRFAAFVEFYDNYYDNVRTYSTDPCLQLDIFDFPAFGVTVAGLCSCHNNDLLNRQGAIHPDCIAEAGTELRQSIYQDRVRIAVWHHNTEGPPMQVDYMDPDAVQNLIDCGFSLGFHGHQHRPDCLDRRFRHGPERHITLISAGTLCGGAAFRFGRAYNVIELDVEHRTGRLHLREMQNDNLLSPIWGPRSLPPYSTSYLDFAFDPAPEPFVRPDATTNALTRAQYLFEQGEYREAADLLSTLPPSDQLARRLLLPCLTQLNDTARIVAHFMPPESPEEAIALMDALWFATDHAGLKDLLKSPVIAESSDPSVIEIREKYARRLAR